MEAALLHSSADHESIYKKARNTSKRNKSQTRSYIPSRTNSAGNLYYSESLPKMEMMVNGGAFLNPPFPLSSSLPRLNSSPYPLQCHQPPLLPLPMASSPSSSQFRSLPTYGGASQLSPSHKKQNKGNKNHTNTKLSKQGSKSVKNSLVKDLNKVILEEDDNTLSFIPKEVEKFSGLVFPEAPPPSSLPMPKFSLKPKISCRVEAANSGGGGGGRVDAAGATSNLCRLLNLR